MCSMATGIVKSIAVALIAGWATMCERGIAETLHLVCGLPMTPMPRRYEPYVLMREAERTASESVAGLSVVFSLCFREFMQTGCNQNRQTPVLGDRERLVERPYSTHKPVLSF